MPSKSSVHEIQKEEQKWNGPQNSSIILHLSSLKNSSISFSPHNPKQCITSYLPKGLKFARAHLTLIWNNSNITYASRWNQMNPCLNYQHQSPKATRTIKDEMINKLSDLLTYKTHKSGWRDLEGLPNVAYH